MANLVTPPVANLQMQHDGIRMYASVSDATQSGATGVIMPAVLIGDDFLSDTLSYGPCKVAAGGTFGQLSFAPNANGTVQYAEVFASNAAGTQSLAAYNATPTIPLVKGVVKALGLADWTAPTLIGADLSIDANGKLKSAAGGVFWVVYYVQLSMP